MFILSITTKSEECGWLDVVGEESLYCVGFAFPGAVGKSSLFPHNNNKQTNKLLKGYTKILGTEILWIWGKFGHKVEGGKKSLLSGRFGDPGHYRIIRESQHVCINKLI